MTKLTGHSRHSGDQVEAVLKHWNELGEPAVDGPILRRIQEQIVAQFGGDAAASPATIARIIADAGGELCHPDVLETDAEWRQARTENQMREFTGLEILLAGEALTLQDAEKMLGRLEELRRKHEHDQVVMPRLRAIAAEARRHAELLAKRVAEESVRAEQTEMAEWMKVWLQTPQLFADWLELRKQSEEFRSKFTLVNHEDTKAQKNKHRL